MSQVRPLPLNFTIVALEIWAYVHQNRQNMEFFDYKSAPMGPIPLWDFYNIWLRRGTPMFAPSGQISPLCLLKCGLTAPEIAKIGNFWYKIGPKRVYFLK